MEFDENKSDAESPSKQNHETACMEVLGKPRTTELYINIPKTNTMTNTCLSEKPSVDKKVKRHSIHGMMEEENVIRPHQEIAQLSLHEKKFLLAVERGDVASTRRMLQRSEETNFININCVDPLGRSALLMAIDNENLEMVELLLEYKVETKDALLHAISEEFVEAVEVLLDHEETIHKAGEPHSWEALPADAASFTPDITPLILSAHRDNYEIIKILLDRGATLPMPHDLRCGCDDCVTSRMEDSLCHSRSRINAYRALASPSLIALSSKDPILTAFELSWELRRLSFMEHEFKNEYQELRRQCQDFATALLDHTRSSYELEVLLNHDPTGPAFEHGDRMHLNRLKLAIKLRQKKDVFMYIMDTYPNLTSHRLCGSVLQSMGCPTGGDFDWTIDIPPPDKENKSLKKKLSAVKDDASTFNILHLSDVHYDPMYKPGGNANCGEPICCQDDQGDAESEEDICGQWADYRSADAPWHLIEEAVRHSKTQDFQYVYYTGDIISHRVWETSKDTNYRDIAKLYSYFKDNFDVPVFPVFGNHEPHPLNVWAPENIDSDDLSIKWLFELAAEQWSALIGEDVSETVLKGGYYSVSPKEGFRVIGINSNLGFTENWWIIYDDVDPFGQLQWLADTLKKAEDNNEKVHILSHVPNGSNSLLKVWSREFKKIIERFSGIITAQFNGHTHKDEFHVYYSSTNTTEPINVAFNGAAVTPYSNSNPSYKVYNVDDTTFTLNDFDEWTFNLTLANTNPITKSPEWYKLYTFSEAYNVQDLSPTEVDKVLYAMTEDNTLLQKYFLYHHRNGDAGIKGGCDSSCQKGFLCSIATSQYDDDTQCNYFVDLFEKNSNQ